jgi:peptidoglycan hydrolase CwlO-like protein
VTVVWSASTAGSDTGQRVKVRKGSACVRLICCLGVAAVFGATLLGPVAPANGDPISSLQAEAAQLSQEMLLEQLQISADQHQQASDLASVAADNAALQATQTRIAATRRRIGADMADLRTAAVKAYVTGGTTQGTVSLFEAGTTQSTTDLYDQVMTGDLSAAVTRLQSDRRALRLEQATQTRVTAAAEQAEAQATAALTEADNTQANLQQQKNQVTGQLAADIQAQQAQEQAAARAAAQAAVQAAQAAPGSPAAPSASSGGPVPGLPPFLACVLRAESGGDYHAVSPTGQYMGAFQFSQSTWNEAANLAGMPSLVGVRPYDASPADQDLLAIALYKADGEQPWYDPCRS